MGLFTSNLQTREVDLKDFLNHLHPRTRKRLEVNHDVSPQLAKRQLEIYDKLNNNNYSHFPVRVVRNHEKYLVKGDRDLITLRALKSKNIRNIKIEYHE